MSQWNLKYFFLQATYICSKHFPPDVDLDWKSNPTLEPYPANTKTQRPRKIPLDRSGETQDVQNVTVERPQNQAKRAKNTYFTDKISENRMKVKEVYVIPKELQGLLSVILHFLQKWTQA